MLEVSVMPITALLERNAREQRDEVALVELNPQLPEEQKVSFKDYPLIRGNVSAPFRSELTWGAFDDKANRMANLLRARGVARGEKVAILLMNGLEWLPVYFGILKAGAVAVPLNYRYTAEEIRYCLDKSDAVVLVFGPEFTGRIETICDEIPQVRFTLYVGDNCPAFSENYFRLASYADSRAPQVELREEDPAAIYFSSGTTGFPKAILHPHRSLSQSCEVEQHHHGQTREDVFLCIPPLYHTGAKMHWFGSLLSGSRAVLLTGAKPEWILRAVSEERCTIVWLLVPWAQDILDAIDRGEVNLSDYTLDQWRLMHIGAQPVPPSLIQRWKQHFPHHDYDTNYGLSESIGPGAVHLGLENTHKVGAIGKAGYGWETRIVTADGHTAGPGEVGELLLRGPGVMTEYYKDPVATAATLKDGWLYTGDVAEQDADGFIYLVDRKKDVIITGGENLYPVQIENELRQLDAIKDVAVIGLPDARLGEIAAAVIEVKEGYTLSEEEVNRFCLTMPRYKRPRKVIFADIPRNPTGKIEKPRLRERYCSDRLVARQNGLEG